MELSILSPTESEKWDDFIYGHDLSTIYHLSCWSKILSETFSYIPRNLVFKNDRGIIEAAIPFMLINSRLTGKRLISLPKIPICDPLINQSHLPLMLDYINKGITDGEFKYCEIRAHYNEQVFAGSSFKPYRGHFNHVLDLSRSFDDIWKSLDRSCVKQRINKAIKNGIIVREGTNIEDLKIFYSLYNNITKKHIIPPKPFRYFSSIWEAFSPSQRLTLLIAEAQGEPAAASLSFSFRHTMYYEYLGLNYRLLDLCAGQLLLWELIQRAHAKGHKVLDFGISEKRNRGLIEYKEKWGTTANDVAYIYFPEVQGYKSSIKNLEKREDTERKSLIEYSLNHLNRKIAQIFYKHFG